MVVQLEFQGVRWSSGPTGVHLAIYREYETPNVSLKGSAGTPVYCVFLERPEASKFASATYPKSHTPRPKALKTTHL